jgi:hypothetical protein
MCVCDVCVCVCIKYNMYSFTHNYNTHAHAHTYIYTYAHYKQITAHLGVQHEQEMSLLQVCRQHTRQPEMETRLAHA